MNFFKFFIRTFLLSFPVALFWLPILVMIAYGIYMVFDLMRDEMLGFIMIAVILVYPIQALLVVLAVRAGMTILKTTTGSDIAKLTGVTWRVLRFDGLLAFVITNVVGISIAVTGLRFMAPDYMTDFWAALGAKGFTRAYELDRLTMEFPLILNIGSLLGLSISVALLAVNVAGAAAMAVDNPPKHHQLWGIGAQFFNIFMMAVIFWIIPFIIVVMLMGGVNTPVSAIYEVNPYYVLGADLYGLWTICLMAAVAAQGYKIHLVDDDVRRKRDIEIMSGVARPTGPAVDLKALRQARMGGKLVSVQDMIDDDEDDDGR